MRSFDEGQIHEQASYTFCHINWAKLFTENSANGQAPEYPQGWEQLSPMHTYAHGLALKAVVQWPEHLKPLFRRCFIFLLISKLCDTFNSDDTRYLWLENRLSVYYESYKMVLSADSCESSSQQWPHCTQRENVTIRKQFDFDFKVEKRRINPKPPSPNQWDRYYLIAPLIKLGIMLEHQSWNNSQLIKVRMRIAKSGHKCITSCQVIRIFESSQDWMTYWAKVKSCQQ